MKLIPPQPKIKLYEEGFKGKDILNRAEQGKQLSNLVEAIEDPLVIALDGGWGSGKSFFLQCWVGAHKNENDGSALTVYFDAFKHDFMDDPLISLTSALAERLDDGDADEKALATKIKETAQVVWKPTARVGLAALIQGLNTVTGGVVGAALDAAQHEVSKATPSIWEQEESKRKAMDGFRTALETYTKPRVGGPRKLVICVDELDRCRPDYALTVLETIKHFFDVPHVYFVLGINLDELGNMVRARYGTDIDASTYLQKFLTLTVKLPERIVEGDKISRAVDRYIEQTVRDFQFGDQRGIIIKNLAFSPNMRSRISLRSFNTIMLNYKWFRPLISADDIPFGHEIIFMCLIFMKVLFPEQFKKFYRDEFSKDDVRQLIKSDLILYEDLNRNPQIDAYTYVAWADFLDQPIKPDDQKTLNLEKVRMRQVQIELWGEAGLQNSTRKLIEYISILDNLGVVGSD